MNNDKKVDISLTEYQVCISDVSQLDSDIWQSSYVFLGISIIGFAILLQTQAHDWIDFSVFAITAIFGVSLIIIWSKLCSVWLRLIHINFYRMREIERQLGMWRERYIHYLVSLKVSHEEYGPEEMERLQQVEKLFKGGGLKDPLAVRKTLKYVHYSIICGWVVLVAKQASFLILSIGS